MIFETEGGWGWRGGFPAEEAKTEIKLDGQAGCGWVGGGHSKRMEQLRQKSSKVRNKTLALTVCPRNTCATLLPQGQKILPE